MSTTGSLPARGHAVVCGLDHLGRRTIGEPLLRDGEVVVAATRAGLGELLHLASGPADPAEMTPTVSDPEYTDAGLILDTSWTSRNSTQSPPMISRG